MPYIGGVGVYRETCDGIATRGYEGFRLAGPQVRAAAAAE
jgi:cyclohexanone monooxygenase